MFVGHSIDERKHTLLWKLASLGYALLIIYGSMYPFTGWASAHSGLLAFLEPNWHHHVPLPDLITNLLAYMPLGVLLARSFPNRGSAAVTTLFCTLVGGLLSFSMEFL